MKLVTELISAYDESPLTTEDTFYGLSNAVADMGTFLKIEESGVVADLMKQVEAEKWTRASFRELNVENVACVLKYFTYEDYELEIINGTFNGELPDIKEYECSWDDWEVLKIYRLIPLYRERLGVSFRHVSKSLLMISVHLVETFYVGIHVC